LRLGQQGGVLTKEAIIDLLKESDYRKRLIITPLLDSNEVLGASSVDVRLGNEFILMRRQNFANLDISDKKVIDNIQHYQERIKLNYQQPFILHPYQLVIGSTLEYVSVPPGLMCYVIGKSSWGRMGLIIATATKVDPGFKGCITLEIVNQGEVPLTLYPGVPIAQLVFHTAVGKSSYDGRYEYPTGPEFPNFLKDYKKWKKWFRKDDF